MVRPNGHWEQYLSDGVETPPIRQGIRAAQARVLLLLEASEGPDTQAVLHSPPQTESISRARDQLLQAARPTLHSLQAALEGRVNRIALVDPQGCVIQWLSPANDDPPEALGTLLGSGEPLILVGPDHLIAAYATWTCLAVPLCGLEREFAGTLALLVPNEQANIHTWRWLQALAAAIESGLREVQRKQCPPSPETGQAAEAQQGIARASVPHRAVASMLAAAGTPDAVLAAIVAAVESEAGCAVEDAVIVVPAPEPAGITELCAYHLLTAAEDTRPKCPETGMPAPMLEVAQVGQPLWFECGEDLAARYPLLAPAQGLAGCRAFAALPLTRSGRVLGVLGLRFAGEMPFAPGTRARLSALASQCAGALLRFLEDEA